MKQSTFNLSALLLGSLVYTNVVAMTSSTTTKETGKGLFPSDRSHILPTDPKKRTRVLLELDRSIKKLELERTQTQKGKNRDVNNLYKDFASLGSPTNPKEVAAAIALMLASKEDDNLNRNRSFNERIEACKKLFITFFETPQCRDFFEKTVFVKKQFKSLFNTTQHYASWLNEKIHTTVKVYDDRDEDEDYDITEDTELGTMLEALKKNRSLFLKNPALLAEAAAEELYDLFTPTTSTCTRESVDYTYGDGICLNDFEKALQHLNNNVQTTFELRILLSIFLETLFCKTDHKLRSANFNSPLSTLIEKLHSILLQELIEKFQAILANSEID